MSAEMNDSSGSNYEIETMKEALHTNDLLIKMFYAPGKHPFYIDNGEIRNLYDLTMFLEYNPMDDVFRLADWIYYLGDEALSRKIYQNPDNVRALVMERYLELSSMFLTGSLSHTMEGHIEGGGEMKLLR